MTSTADSQAAAFFLDRDGVILRDAGYLCDPAAVELLPGAAEALRRAIRTHRLYLFSNQSGIGRGLYTLEQALAVQARMLELLDLPPPGFTAVCLAPEPPDGPIQYRKPSPRFILERLREDHLDPAACWMLGDRLSDLQAGLTAGIRAALIHNPAHDDEATRQYLADHALQVFDSLAAALQTLLQLPLQPPGLQNAAILANMPWPQKNAKD